MLLDREHPGGCVRTRPDGLCTTGSLRGPPPAKASQRHRKGGCQRRQADNLPQRDQKAVEQKGERHKQQAKEEPKPNAQRGRFPARLQNCIPERP